MFSRSSAFEAVNFPLKSLEHAFRPISTLVLPFNFYFKVSYFLR